MEGSWDFIGIFRQFRGILVRDLKDFRSLRFIGDF